MIQFRTWILRNLLINFLILRNVIFFYCKQTSLVQKLTIKEEILKIFFHHIMFYKHKNFVFISWKCIILIIYCKNQWCSLKGCYVNSWTFFWLDKAKKILWNLWWKGFAREYSNISVSVIYLYSYFKQKNFILFLTKYVENMNILMIRL